MTKYGQNAIFFWQLHLHTLFIKVLGRRRVNVTKSKNQNFLKPPCVNYCVFELTCRWRHPINAVVLNFLPSPCLLFTQLGSAVHLRFVLFLSGEPFKKKYFMVQLKNTFEKLNFFQPTGLGHQKTTTTNLPFFLLVTVQIIKTRNWSVSSRSNHILKKKTYLFKNQASYVTH